MSQPNRDFPVDCETLDGLQELAEYAAVLGNLGGDRIILTGCEADEHSIKRRPGYVFLRTEAKPDGEVLWFEGGLAAAMKVVEIPVSVTANGTEYKSAYKKRKLVGTRLSADALRWEDFTRVKSLREQWEELAALRKEIKLIPRAPLGSIEIWAGSCEDLPENYMPCDGRVLFQEEYPDLYAVIGDRYVDNGRPGGFPTGMFRIPDLRGRFVVGMDANDEDYAEPGLYGGTKKVELTVDQMPSHAHELMFSAHVNGVRSEQGGTEGRIITSPNMPHSETESSGGGAAHENRPPYLVLGYIMRVK